ncbi:hypothetical protein [uncultured Psychrobacter sp.]|uniref:hypothetical protein n=1 Tax=uncultured Psychrobacter sp. TaxID=259303 RepID=UPI002596181D|nr:hypothetical protein [uncultured Psychrobacter sp.]
MTEKALSIIIQREDLPQLFGKRVENQAAIEEVISKIETESRSITFDINTKDGQATCRSLAAKIASAKSALDKAGKAKKDEYTVTTKLIDADRNLAKSRLQALQDEIRQPLTELEEREKARKAQHEANIENMTADSFINTEEISSKSIKELITTLENKVIGDEWEEYKSQALEVKDDALRRLRTQLESVLKREAEQAELERLRKEEAERKQSERDAEIARQAEERAKAEAEKRAKAERERAEREIREAKEREARLVAEKEAAELRAKQQAEQARIAERERIEAEQAEQAKLEAKRKADKAHREKIFFDAKDDLVNGGIEEDIAKQVIKLIHSGKVRSISIKF